MEMKKFSDLTYAERVQLITKNPSIKRIAQKAGLDDIKVMYEEDWFFGISHTINWRRKNFRFGDAVTAPMIAAHLISIQGDFGYFSDKDWEAVKPKLENVCNMNQIEREAWKMEMEKIISEQVKEEVDYLNIDANLAEYLYCDDDYSLPAVRFLGKCYVHGDHVYERVM